MRESVWYVGKGRGGRGLSMMEWSAVEWMGGGPCDERKTHVIGGKLLA